LPAGFCVVAKSTGVVGRIDAAATPQAVTSAPLPRRMERSSEFADALMIVISVFGLPSTDESAGLRGSKPP
jgi:hypothetical protein